MTAIDRYALDGFELHMQAGVPSRITLGRYESEQIVGAILALVPEPAEDERAALDKILAANRVGNGGLADVILAAGYRRQPAPVVTEEIPKRLRKIAQEYRMATRCTWADGSRMTLEERLAAGFAIDLALDEVSAALTPEASQ